jgi:RNA polymerase sigma factor (sigma-70 family)
MNQPSPTRSTPLSLLTREQWPVLKRWFRSKVPEPDCYDLVQDTLVEVVKRGGVPEGANPKHYTLGIARHLLIHYIKERRAGVEFDATKHSVLGAETTISVRLDKRNMILNTLRALPLQHQMAFELHYCENLPIKDLAAVMERDETTIRRFLSAAADKLREQMKGKTAGDPVAAVADAYRAG